MALKTDKPDEKEKEKKTNCRNNENLIPTLGSECHSNLNMNTRMYGNKTVKH